MSLDEKTVRHVAKLARIRLDESEASAYTKELSSIFNWIEQLNEVEDNHSIAVASVVEHNLPMREDSITDGQIAEKVLANATDAQYGCYVVPKVIDQG